MHLENLPFNYEEAVAVLLFVIGFCMLLFSRNLIKKVSISGLLPPPKSPRAAFKSIKNRPPPDIALHSFPPALGRLRLLVPPRGAARPAPLA